MRRTLCRFALLLTAVGGVALIVPSLAAASRTSRFLTPSCGSTVFSSVTLTRDMECPNLKPGQSAIYFGADNATVNLDGFNIEGPGAVGNDPDGTTGINNTGASPNPNSVCPCNHDTVEGGGGTISGYGTALDFENTSRNTLTALSASDNSSDGVILDNSSHTVISSVSSDSNGGDGFAMENNHNTSLTGDAAANNSSDGYFDESSLATLSNDRAVGNGVDGFAVDFPLKLVTAKGKVLYYLYTGSTAISNGEDGFRVTNNASTTTNQAQLKNNHAEDNGELDITGNGWGYWAQVQVASGSTGNLASGNFSGNCHHVPCTTG